MRTKDRDLVETSRLLESLFATRLGPGARVDDLSIPRSGYSNETLVGRVAYRDGQQLREQRFVLRIQPTEHQLFVTADAIRQAKVMAAIAESSTLPVPGIMFSEADPSILGAPFFVMDFVDGRIPSDIPSWHAHGWTTSLEPGQLERLYRNAIGALADLHALDLEPRFTFLAAADGRSPLDSYLANLTAWHHWCGSNPLLDEPTVHDVLEWLPSHRPTCTRTSLLWGDARVGNMVFAQDFAVAALLDWEGACIGPPEVDVAWWLIFEDYLSEAQGLTRLQGVLDRESTITAYERLSGQPLCDLPYYEVLAGFALVLITARLAEVLVRAGRMRPTSSPEFFSRAIDVTRDRLRSARSYG
jgi:aminoglycoside phosphotransferase (APT) family kinase protein